MKKLRWSIVRMSLSVTTMPLSAAYSVDFPISNLKKLGWLIWWLIWWLIHLIVRESNSNETAPTSLSNELQYIQWEGYPGSRFPDSFQPTNLAVLRLRSGLQKELWKGWKHLPRLKVLRLIFMNKLVSTPDFDGLPCLQELLICSCDEIKVIHSSLGNNKSVKKIAIQCCSNIRKFPRIDHMEKLEALEIFSVHRNFEIPEIQSDMEKLVTLLLRGFRMQVFLSSVAVHCPNLISLKATENNNPYRSCLNHFSNLDFNFSKVTMLVHLDLSYCYWLKKLPEFPSSLVIFQADKCNRLTDVGDSVRNCKWLSQVSVVDGGILNDGVILLHSMLQGKAIEKHSMFLLLEGLQIPREFRPRLRAGQECTLQLPQNWCNYFCGFLICAVTLLHRPKIVMRQVRGGSMGIDSEDDAVWKETVDDKSRTWVGYISFGSLRPTAAWLDETCKAVSFSITIQTFEDLELCRGFGVSLVPRPSGSGSTDTSPPEYYPEDDFKPEFEIKDDLTCTFKIPSKVYWC